MLPPVKINGQNYREVFLAQKLLPAIKEFLGYFSNFQQDSASVRMRVSFGIQFSFQWWKNFEDRWTFKQIKIKYDRRV